MVERVGWTNGMGMEDEEEEGRMSRVAIACGWHRGGGWE